MNKNIVLAILTIYFISLILSMVVSFDLSNAQMYENTPTKESNFLSFSMYLHLLKVNFFVYFLLIMGVFTFKITTIINIISNGIVLGVYTPLLFKYKVISFFIHAPFELTGLFLGAYIGFSNWKEIKYNKKKYITIFSVGCILILIAGFLENYVTPLFLN